MSTTTNPTQLLDLPLEVIQRIFTHCHPRVVARISETCRTAHDLIYHPGDQYLWRHLYHAYPFDNLETPEGHSLNAEIRGAGAGDALDYRELLTLLVRAESVATRSPPQTAEEERETLRIFNSVLTWLPPVEGRTDDGAVRPSHNAEWLESVLDEDLPLLTSSVSGPLVPTEVYDEVEGMKARLRCSLLSSFKQAIDLDCILSKEDEAFFVAKRNRSRTFVYDLRNYTRKTGWGPFTTDNKVNWVHVEHMMNVVWMNLAEWALPGMPRPRIGTEAFRPHSSGGEFTTGDWAGVQGVWSRYICFMDYRDLFSFNIQSMEAANDDREPLDQDFFSDPMFREATRLLQVTLTLVDESTLDLKGCGKNFPIKHIRDPARPPLFFKGSSRGADGASVSVIKGCVYEEMDGSIRWRFVRESIYDNSPQWSSSGVQIGGIGSAVGVIGNWTTVSHDQDDPVGPFWMFKDAGKASIPVMDLN